MTSESSEMIKTLIQIELDKSTALYHYYSHQRGMHPEHRVCEESDDEIGQIIKTTWNNINKLMKVLREFEDEQNIIK